jgi:transcriptional regulator with XRE-family HTH domain
MARQSARTSRPSKPATRAAKPSRSPGNESFGARLARIRKDRGFTQVELADRTGLIQVLISDYEHDKLRPYADVAARLAQALGVSTDQLLGLQPLEQSNGSPVNRRFLRRLQKIDHLPRRDQEALLRTIDAFLDRSGALR